MEHDNSADAKTSHSPQSDTLKRARAEVQRVGKDRRDRTDQSHHIEPEWGADSPDILAQPELQEKSSKADGCDYYQSQWAEERGAARVDHHQGEGEQEQSCGEDRPAARTSACVRIGSGVGQGIPLKLYRQ
jgi:hypothetical protein